MSKAEKYLQTLDRSYYLIYLSELILILLVFVYLIKLIRNNKQKKNAERFLEEYLGDEEKLVTIKHIDGYDDLFKSIKNPEQNPSVFSPFYSDFHPPLIFKDYSKAVEIANEIYFIPEACKDCLGGAQLIRLFFLAPDNFSNAYLFSPIECGFVRNQSENSLFNLVKEGKISMTTPSSHSPLFATLVNKTLDVLNVLIPKGSVFKGVLASLTPLVTTEPVQITLKQQEKKDLNLNHKPEFTHSMWSCSNGLHVCPCGYGSCSHDDYYVRTSGNYKLTPFFETG